MTRHFLTALAVSVLALGTAHADDPLVSPIPAEQPQVGQQNDSLGEPEPFVGTVDLAPYGFSEASQAWTVSSGLDNRFDTHPSDTVTLPEPQALFSIDLR